MPPKVNRKKGGGNGRASRSSGSLSENLLPSRPAPAVVNVTRPSSPGQSAAAAGARELSDVASRSFEPEPEPEPELARTRTNYAQSTASALKGMYSTNTIGNTPILLQAIESDEPDEFEVDQEEGFKWTVFFPQLLLRLVPPLMLLQLLPHFRPRVDEVAFAIGTTLIVLTTSWSFALGCAALLCTISVCQFLAAVSVGELWARKRGVVFPLVGGLFFILLYLLTQAAGRKWKQPWDFSEDGAHSMFSSLATILLAWVPCLLGCACILSVVCAWIYWLATWLLLTKCGCDRAEKREEWAWSRPRGVGLFAERFPLGDFKICGDQLKWCRGEYSHRGGAVARLDGDGWGQRVSIRLGAKDKLFEADKHKKQRLLETCIDLADSGGELRPAKVHRIFWEDKQWKTQATRHYQSNSKNLSVKVRYDKKDKKIVLDREKVVLDREKVVLDRPPQADRGVGPNFILGYRVRHGNERIAQSVVEIDGDYDPDFAGQSDDPRFRNLAKFALRQSSEAWTIESDEKTLRDPEYDQLDYDDRDPSAYFQASHGMARNRGARSGWSAAPEIAPTEGWTSLQAAATPQSDAPEIEVRGYYKVQYEVVFPRRLDLNFKRMLGATVRGGNTSVEFLILQIEAFTFLFILESLLLVMVQFYETNLALKSGINLADSPIHGSFLGIPQWIFLWMTWAPNAIGMRDILTHKNSLADPDPESEDRSCGMLLPDSEVLLPVMMYVFVALVSAHEHACFNGLDTLASSREDRWYQRALLYDKENGSAFGWKFHRCCNRRGADAAVSQSAMPLEDSCSDRTKDWIWRNLKESGKKLAALITLAVSVLMLYLIDHAAHKKFSMLLMVLLFGAGVTFCTLQSFSYVYWIFLHFCLLLCRTANDLLCAKDATDATSEPKWGTMKWFKQEVEQMDTKVMHAQSMRYDKRDAVRQHELMHTYVEAPRWETYEEDSHSDAFESLDRTTDSEFQRIRDSMKVYPLQATGPADQLREGLDPYSQMDRLEQYGSHTCVSVWHIAEMVMHLSKARRLVHQQGRWLILLVAGFHGGMSIWHPLLPCELGGGCQCENNTETFDVNSDDWPSSSIACSSTWEQVCIHLVLAAINAVLTKSILTRLANCQSDYYARYCNLLYFVQLTPWSTMPKVKKHWGLLPTFDLDTAGNIEAWNKLRLYLQAYRIKTSQYMQVSVLWCFGAVMLMTLFKGWVFVHSNSSDGLSHCSAMEGPGDKTTPSLQEECSDQGGCLWRHELKTGVGWACGFACRSDGGHFDTFAMFVLVDTLVIGLGLAYTLWWGVHENEIKQEAFPYLLGMKRTELSSSAVHFVTERANHSSAAKMESGWRAEERQLLKIAKRSETLASTGSLGSQVKVIEQRVKENEHHGLEFFRQSRTPQSDAASTLTDAAITNYEHDVYICHLPSKAGGIVRALKAVFLQQHGLTTKVISGIESEQAVDERMLSAIRTAEVFCLFLSGPTEDAIEREFVQIQIREAFREHKYILLFHDDGDGQGRTKVDMAELAARHKAGNMDIKIDKKTKEKLLTNGQLEWLLSLKTHPLPELTDKTQLKVFSDVVMAAKGVAAAKVQHKQDAASATRSRDSTVTTVRRQVRPDEHNWKQTDTCKRPPLHLSGAEPAEDWRRQADGEEEKIRYATCLDRDFVQKEIRWAQEYSKEIITVFEREERKPGFFDYTKAWKKYGGTEWEFLLNIDAIAYQRDEFQAEAMLKNIYAKSDVYKRPAPLPKNNSNGKTVRQNDPGAWDFFLSHAQVTASDQANMTRMRLEADGKAVWYDNAMTDKSTGAMEEGIKQCACVVLFLTSTPPDETAAEEEKKEVEAKAESSIQELTRSAMVTIQAAADDAFAGPEQARLQEKERCITMLRELGETITQEYSRSRGGGSHWGSEDRRTKMWFVALTKPRLYAFIAVLATQVAATAIRGAMEFQ